MRVEKAFRHGDIENILSDVVKAAAHAHSSGGGLLGFAKKIASEVSGGKKFSKKDIKRIYFVSCHPLVSSRHPSLDSRLGKLAP